MKRWLIFTLIAAAHFVTCIACAMAEFQTSSFLPPFDAADPSHPFWASVAAALTMPAALLMGGSVEQDTALSSILIVLNSLLWAGAIYSLGRLAIGRVRNRPRVAGPAANIR